MSDPTLEAALRVVRVLEGLGIRTAVIGGWALAVHGYDRATDDLDLAAVFHPGADGMWWRLQRALEGAGFEVEERPADREDALGGVYVLTTPGASPIEVVNYLNPYRGAPPVAAAAIESASTGAAGLPVVDLAHLVALKLYAGLGGKSGEDLLILMRGRSVEERERVGAVCKRVGLAPEWLALVELLAAD